MMAERKLDNRSLEIPHMMSTGYESDEREKMDSDSFDDEFQPYVHQMKKWESRAPSFRFERRRNRDSEENKREHESPEDLELMTVTVLDGILDSNIKQAFVKVTDNVHILKQSSLQASRNKENRENEDTIQDTNFEAKKPITGSQTFSETKFGEKKFDLSPKSVMSFHYNTSLSEAYKTSSKHKRTTSQDDSGSNATKLQFYDGRPSDEAIEFRPSHHRSTVNFQSAPQHKRVHSTGNHRLFRSSEKSALRPSRYLASTISSSKTTSSVHNDILYRELRHSRSWSPLTAAISSGDAGSTSSKYSTKSSLSVSKQLYPPKTKLPRDVSCIFKNVSISTSSKASNESTLSGITSTFSKSTGSYSSEPSTEHERIVDSLMWTNQTTSHNPPSINLKDRPSLETIRDDSPYNSPKVSFSKNWQKQSSSENKKLSSQNVSSQKHIVENQDRHNASFVKMNMIQKEGVEVNCQCSIM